MDRLQQLIRQGAELALTAPPEWFDELDEATLAGPAMAVIAADPVLAAAIRRTNRSNLLAWAAANVSAPGAPVPPNVGEATLDVARDLVRRGLDATALDAYRVGQGVALRRWIDLAFELTDDHAELRELLDVTTRSIAAFVDATIAATAAQVDSERAELAGGTHAERRETVALVLEGAPIPPRRAEARLGYPLTGSHTAAVVWSDDPGGSSLRELDRAAELLGDGHPLVVLASAATRWVWVHGSPDLPALRRAVRDLPGVRVALGPVGDGVDGFRRSHLDALTTQRMLTRLASAEQVAAYGEIELASLVTQDEERAARFVSATLGALEHGPADVAEAVRSYLAAGGNATRAAEAGFTHRNTLLRRLARADELLPRPLAEAPLAVGVALEVLRWRGLRPVSRSWRRR